MGAAATDSLIHALQCPDPFTRLTTESTLDSIQKISHYADQPLFYSSHAPPPPSRKIWARNFPIYIHQAITALRSGEFTLQDNRSRCRPHFICRTSTLLRNQDILCREQGLPPNPIIQTALRTLAHIEDERLACIFPSVQLPSRSDLTINSIGTHLTSELLADLNNTPPYQKRDHKPTKRISIQARANLAMAVATAWHYLVSADQVPFATRKELESQSTWHASAPPWPIPKPQAAPNFHSPRKSLA